MYTVVGGGVAGVCCVQELLHLLEDSPASSTSPAITFICGKSGFVKTTDQITRIGEVAESFTVKECQADSFFQSDKVKVIQEDVIGWDYKKKELSLSNGQLVNYGKLCIATGAKPVFNFVGPHIVCLRDMDTITDFKKRLSGARRIILVGNGGIANELAFELKGIEVVWAIRHPNIIASYFDKQAAALFWPRLQEGRPEGTMKPEAKRDRYTVDNNNQKNPWAHGGCALGPHWIAKLHQGGEESSKTRQLHLIPDVELTDVRNFMSGDKTTPALPESFTPDSEENPWKCLVKLTNGDTVGADFVVLAIGVTPNSEIWSKECPDLKLDEEYGIVVDTTLRTSLPDVYAAGDVCGLKIPENRHWTQMRLWTQARSMGMFCARSMVLGDEIEPDISFEIFTHVTSFYGYEVVLLGDFAGQKLETPYDAHVRCDENAYVKVLVKNKTIHGTVLIGDTDLSETFQNLILNQTDISEVEEDLLNPLFDLEDYYD